MFYIIKHIDTQSVSMSIGGDFGFLMLEHRTFAVGQVSRQPGIEVSSVRDVNLNHLRILQKINIVYKVIPRSVKTLGAGTGEDNNFANSTFFLSVCVTMTLEESSIGKNPWQTLRNAILNNTEFMSFPKLEKNRNQTYGTSKKSFCNAKRYFGNSFVTSSLHYQL